MSEYKEQAQKIVEKALLNGADETEVFISKGKSTGFSIQNNAIEAASGREEFGFGIRIIKNKRIGFAYSTILDNAEDTIKKAISSSKLSEPTSYSFPKPSKITNIHNIYDKKIANLEPNQCISFLSDLIRSACSVNSSIVVSGGGMSAGENDFTIVNSHGLCFSENETFVSVSAGVLFNGNEKTTGFDMVESRVFDVDFCSVGKNAAQMALDMRKAKKMESKKTAVIFTPFTFEPLLEFIVTPALYGDQAMRGSTFFSNKIGSAVIDESLTVLDDPLLDSGLNSCSIDDEGTASRKTVLIDEGVLRSFLYDSITASKYSTISTSNGIRAEDFKGVPRTAARNLIVQSPNSSSFQNLLRDTSDGVLVYELLGAHTSNPASGDFSVGSSILFRIKNGEIAYPLKKAMLAGNMFSSIKKSAEIGNDYKKLSGSFSPSSFYIPSIRLQDVNVIT